MKQLLLVLLALVLATSPLYAADPDPRLANVRKAVVLAADDLSDDKIVASCVAERIGKATPIQIVATHEEAELILTVSEASVGKHPKGKMTAALPDGSVLWTGRSKTRGFNLVGRNMTCVIANDLIDNLRKAMQKAREITEKANRASLR